MPASSPASDQGSSFSGSEARDAFRSEQPAGRDGARPTRSMVWTLLLPIPLVCAIAVVMALLLVPRLLEDDATRDETEAARRSVQQFQVMRAYYTRAVSSKVLAHGGMHTSTSPGADPDAIPAPSTMVHELSGLMSGQGTRVRVYSPYPFPNRAGRVLEPFEQKAWDFLSSHPDQAFARRDEVNGQPVMRVALADRMTETACVSCHNATPGLAKRDWKVGDVRGVMEVDTDLGPHLARERHLLFLLLCGGLGCAALLSLVSVLQARRISRPIRALTAIMHRLARGDTTVAVSLPPRRDEVGTMAAAVAVFKTNALAKLEADRELSIANVRFDAALNNMSQGLVLHGADGAVVVTNRRFREMFGLEHVASGTDLRAVLEASMALGNHPGHDLDELWAERMHAMRQREPVTGLQRLRGGRLVALSQQPIADGGWVVTYEDVTERRRAEAQIAFMAHHDALTRLPNRVLLQERLEQVMAQVGRGGRAALLCLDLDRFKPINDTLGHAAGDELLRQVALRLSACVREVDTVARLGGDEFAVVQTGIERAEDTSLLAERVIGALTQPFALGEHTVVVGTSIGVALAPTDATGADRLLKCADMALYRAKMDGRGTHRFFEAGMDARLQARRALELDLRRALQAGEFALYYQPLVDLRSNRVSAFEALLRWRHPERGLVPPDDFIPLAEETGLIVELGAWVLEHACACAATWLGEQRVAVNLSAAQVRSPRLLGQVERALELSGLPAGRLELEITESVLLQNSEATLAVLHALHELGTPISMDDFGTGYSSLSYLRSFPFDKIKIDRSFISDLCEKPDAAHIVRAVTGLGQSLGMATTAEGVETAEQLSHLRREGCTEVQGYLFSPPRPMEEIPEILGRACDLLATDCARGQGP